MDCVSQEGACATLLNVRASRHGKQDQTTQEGFYAVQDGGKILYNAQKGEALTESIFDCCKAKSKSESWVLASYMGIYDCNALLWKKVATQFVIEGYVST